MKTIDRICWMLTAVSVGSLILNIGMTIYLCISFGGYTEAMREAQKVESLPLVEQYEYMVDCFEEGIKGF